MVFLNPGKPSGQHLSGNLHVRLSIISLLTEATHKHTDSGCLPDGMESSYVIPETCSLHIRMLSCVQGSGGRALLWGQPVRLPSLAMCPLFLYGEGAVGCRWGHRALVMTPPWYWRVLSDNTASPRDTAILGSTEFLGPLDRTLVIDTNGSCHLCQSENDCGP